MSQRQVELGIAYPAVLLWSATIRPRWLSIRRAFRVRSPRAQSKQKGRASRRRTLASTASSCTPHSLGQLDRNSTPGSVREISKYLKAEVRLTRFSTVSPPGKKTTESQSDAWQSRAHDRARNILNEDRPYVYEKSVGGITLHQPARSDSGDLIRIQHSRIEDWVHEIANGVQIAYVSESQVVPELMPEIH